MAVAQIPFVESGGPRVITAWPPIDVSEYPSLPVPDGVGDKTAGPLYEVLHSEAGRTTLEFKDGIFDVSSECNASFLRHASALARHIDHREMRIGFDGFFLYLCLSSRIEPGELDEIDQKDWPHLIDRGTDHDGNQTFALTPGGFGYDKHERLRQLGRCASEVIAPSLGRIVLPNLIVQRPPNADSLFFLPNRSV